MTSEPGFVIEGVDVDDGGRTTLHECGSSGEARRWLAEYVRSEDAGGWGLIEVYDVRGDDAERVGYWDRSEAGA